MGIIALWEGLLFRVEQCSTLATVYYDMDDGTLVWWATRSGKGPRQSDSYSVT